MEQHWTTRSLEDLRFSVGADFIVQLQRQMDKKDISQSDVAVTMGISKSAVSQLLSEVRNNNFTLDTILRLSAAVGLKPAIVLYETPRRSGAPIIAEIFSHCWESLKRPETFFRWHKNNKCKLRLCN